MKKLIVLLVILGLVRVEVHAKPAWDDTGDFETQLDMWLENHIEVQKIRFEHPEFGKFYPPHVRIYREQVLATREVPDDFDLDLTLRTDIVSEPWKYTAMAVFVPPVRQRFVGINVEEHANTPEESRVHPHLGLLYVGTVAERAGYEVKLHDELIEGHAPLETLVKEGDIVGLSLVTTGIERGVELARCAKALGASLVIAGNDSAAFRARQLLSLPGAPIDAVFTSNSLRSIRSFFEQATVLEPKRMQIEHVAVDAQLAPLVTNESSGLPAQRKGFDADDFFLVPNLALFGGEYWDKVWSAYRSQFGHKHRNPGDVRNASALLAQGCGRAGMGDMCSYCTILHAANVVMPEPGYLEETLDTYRAFGINSFFNVTDSAFEMGPLVHRLKEVGPVDSMTIYGRSQPIAQRPKRLDEWLKVVEHRLLINCGMDSADESILQGGINKSSSKSGSRVEENRQAIRTIKAAGPKAHLHYSLIFGSLGETEDSCKRNLEFLQWSIDTLGPQLDVVEGDIFWVNHGAPCSVIFHDYDEAKRWAERAGNTLSRDEWHRNFEQYADELVVPQICEENWYKFFTSISYETAQLYNAQVKRMMKSVPGAVTGRDFAFKPPPV